MRYLAIVLERVLSHTIWKRYIFARIGAINDDRQEQEAALVVRTRDVPILRAQLLRELAPLLYPSVIPVQPRWICVAVSGADAPEGGLIGLVTGAWFSVDLLWLPEHHRGQGLGTAVLARAEEEAARMGCRGATVGTSSPGARRFYEGRGYLPRLELPELYPGLIQTTLQKTFAPI